MVASNQTNKARFKPLQQIAITYDELYSAFIKGAVYGLPASMM
jgi:hypothetical protein